MTSQPDDFVAVQLLAILNDPDAPEGDQLDAAMDLEDHSGTWFEQEIFKILRREQFESVLAQHCAESLAPRPGPARSPRHPRSPRPAPDPGRRQGRLKVLPPATWPIGPNEARRSGC